MEESRKNFEQELRAFENSPKGTLGRRIYEEVTRYVNESNQDRKMTIGNIQAAESFVWEEVWRLTRLADEEEKKREQERVIWDEQDTEFSKNNEV